METITDFQIWIDNLDSHDIEDIFNLYECISQKSEMGNFRYSEKGGRVFITCTCNKLKLMLASDSAIQAFLSKLDIDFSGEFGWVGGQWEFDRNMRKDN